MLAYLLILLLSCGYLVVYARHCFLQKRVLPAVGALLLLVLPGVCAVTFVCILLGLSPK